VFHIGFVAVPRDSHRQRVYLCITKEVLHKTPLRRLESLRRILSPLSQHPDAVRRMDQTDGWKRWVWWRSVVALGYPLHFQFGRQPREGYVWSVSPLARVDRGARSCTANCGVKVQGAACLLACLFVTTAGTLVSCSRQCSEVDYWLTLARKWATKWENWTRRIEWRLQWSCSVNFRGPGKYIKWFIKGEIRFKAENCRTCCCILEALHVP
jgi:hypothetical protein